MRTDKNRRNHVPRDSKASERREGNRHARRMVKTEIRNLLTA